MSNLDPLTNGSYWGPKNLPPEGLFAERAYLFAGYVFGVGFAAQFVIYVAVMRILWSRRNVIHTSRTLMIHSTVMCLVNFFTALATYVSLEEAFIQNVNFPLGGALGYVGASTGLWFHVLIVAGTITSNVLCDFILLWRCRVIWRVGSLGSNPIAANLLMILPTMMLFATIGIGITWTVESATPISFLNPTVVHLSTAYYCISIALNLLLTLMIIFRMKRYQKDIVRYFGAREGAVYTSISTIFIESAALWSLVSIPLLVTITIESPLADVFSGMTSPIQICSSYFIIWRVADGRAWSNDMMMMSRASDLEFKRSDRNNFPSRGIVVAGTDEIRLETLRSNRTSRSLSNSIEPPIPSEPIVDSKNIVPRWDDTF